jgi:hypothetical protein
MSNFRFLALKCETRRDDVSEKHEGTTLAKNTKGRRLFVFSLFRIFEGKSENTTERGRLQHIKSVVYSHSICHIFAFSHCYIFTLMHFGFFAWLHFRIVTFSHCCIFAFSHCYIFVFSRSDCTCAWRHQSENTLTLQLMTFYAPRKVII